MNCIPGATADTINLMCDACGVLVTTDATPVRDPEVVWPLLAARGWTGSPFPAGAHRCPDCVTAQPPVDDTMTDRPRAAPLVRAVAGTDGGVRARGGGDTGRRHHRRRRRSAAPVSRRGRGLRQARPARLANVRTIDPAGLAALVRGHCDAKQRRRALCLAAPSRFVLTALRTMRLHAVLPLFTDRRMALLWLAAEHTAADRELGRRRHDAGCR